MIMINPVRAPFDLAAPDFRRRRSADLADWLLSVAEHFDADDAALVEAVFDRGLTLKQVARVRGESRHCVSRRIKQIAARASSPEFVWTIRHCAGWPPLRRRIAERVILRGEAAQSVAASLGRSVYHVRKELAIIRGLYEIELDEQSRRDGGVR